MAREEPVLLALNAMGTRFELVLWGDEETRLRAAGEEAFGEIRRLEAQLSLYRADSDIRDLNANAAYKAVRVEPRLFRLLERCAALSRETEGAFDITVAPLMRCWGFVGGEGRMPAEEEIEAARELVGMDHVILDADEFTVRFDREGVMLDLGSIGKGYAIDSAVQLLRDLGMENALLHGGTSAVYGMGAPPDADAWVIAIKDPRDTASESLLTEVTLRDSALSVSAPHGKSFAEDGQRYGHVLDPLTGRPVRGRLLAALVTESATEGDALSTGLLTLGSEWLPVLRALHPDYRALIAEEDEKDEMQLSIDVRILKPSA